jgi:hypothetical protein
MTKNPQVMRQPAAMHAFIFLLLCAVMWTLVRPYGGLVHDAQLYAAQALATLDPSILGGDIFLRFGSQNDFTIFPRVYARLLETVGLERAAAILTFVCSLLWLALGWMCARRLSSTHMAWLALGLLISVKAWYGAYHVFRGGELFLSARLPAEVLSLAAITAYLSGHRLAAGVLVLIAGTLHPLMALPVGLLLGFILVEQRWGVEGLKTLFPVLIIGGTAATLLVPNDIGVNSDAWVTAMQTRNTFLFPVEWRLADWQHHALVLSTVLFAYVSARSSLLVSFSASTIMLGVTGVALAVIAGAIPESPTLLQAQPWRWLWPVVITAIIVLPITLTHLWQAEAASLNRSCAILLLSSWITMSTIGGGLAIAALCIYWKQSDLSHSARRAIRFGAWFVLIAAVLSAILTAWQCALYPLDSGSDARLTQRLVNALPTNSIAVTAIMACWLLAGLTARSRVASFVAVACSLALLFVVMPRAHRTWTAERYTAEAYEAFASWRAIIPETSEVLWPSNPTGVWILLERRSYMSRQQFAGLLYSPNLVPTMQARAAALEPLVAPGWWTLAAHSDTGAPKELTPDLLNQICRAPELDYVVAGNEIDGYIATAMFPAERVRVFLYKCGEAHGHRDV